MQEARKYQLCRMVLVNAGTNMHVPSGRITAIDPRGGAAVLGDNGVGKTTTLRILPLFFGHLPSQIVSGGQGQEAMIRFILPTDASAVAFEYQRGSNNEEDLRLVVIRRRSDDPDVPFYRMYRCGFRKELFVEDGRFLEDERTQLKATGFDIQTTTKLTTSEYRSVILRAPAASKEKERLRRYALEWSFGPKPLDNLDRLVAAMVKKHINFSDIVQVAVGLVQQDLGLGAERAKLTFKQGRGQIERWLKNRDACVDAFRLAPKLAELEEALKEHRAAEAKLRARRADVAAVKVARLFEQGELAQAIAALTTERELAVQAEAEQRATLVIAASQASATAQKAKGDYETQAQQAEFFEKNRASYWETQVQDLPILRMSKQTLDDQIAAALSAHSEANANYESLKQAARTAASQRSLELELDKQPHRDRLDTALMQIGQAEDDAKNQAEALNFASRDQLALTLDPLLEQKGAWEGRKAAPAASEAAHMAVKDANERLRQHMEEQGRAVRAVSDTENAHTRAKREFSDREQDLRAAKAGYEAAKLALERARRVLAPNPGTLLAVLRGHKTEDWKRNLAKVIHPDLLDRDDLDPLAVEEAGQTIYGWQLSTGVLAAPEWTDDELARQAVEAAQAREAMAAEQVESAQEAMAAKSGAQKDAETAEDVARARLVVLDAQADSLKNALAAANQQVDTEKRGAAALAEKEIGRLVGEIKVIRGQQASLQFRLAEEMTAIRKAHDQQRAEARRLQDEAIAAIDASIVRLGVELKSTLESLDSQLAQHLSDAGVDVKCLEALKSQAEAVANEVRQREDKEPMVQRWRAWVAQGGMPRVEALKGAAQQAHEHSSARTSMLTEFDQKALNARQEYEAALDTKNKRASDIEDELKVLAALDEEFADYQAVGVSVIDVKTTARELRARVTDDKTALSKVEDSIGRKFSTIRQALTAKDTAVRELVEASLQRVEEAGDITRAYELCSCYKLIGPQVGNDVNLTLKTLLTNIGAFQKSIQAFEREVAAFNRRLQAGLSEVRCFERIKDLRLDIITNFESLGFYKKLARMDDIVRMHKNDAGKTFQDLPPEETARAMGDFMSVLGNDGSIEVNLSAHITLRGRVTDNGQVKEFKRSSELENISSEGLTNLVLITLMTALLNTIRGAEPVHVPWVTDEVGRFDPKNFVALMTMLRDNRIDVVTASPELGTTQQAMFAKHYIFEDRGRIREYTPKALLQRVAVQLPGVESQEVLP